MNILPIPTEPWLDRLRQNHQVWCVKEEKIAWVVWAWEPQDGSRTGRIALQSRVDNYVQPIELWFADVLGRGIDKSQILAPIEGHLPEEASPISEPVIRQLMRSISQLSHRVEQLETFVRQSQTLRF